MIRFYTQQHRFYGGVDLYARTLAFCILDTTETIVQQKSTIAGPDAFLHAVALFRDGLSPFTPLPFIHHCLRP